VLVGCETMLVGHAVTCVHRLTLITLTVPGVCLRAVLQVGTASYGHGRGRRWRYGTNALRMWSGWVLGAASSLARFASSVAR
jgi:hypothetical protein